VTKNTMNRMMGARVWIGFRERPPLLTDGVFEGTYAFNV